VLDGLFILLQAGIVVPFFLLSIRHRELVLFGQNFRLWGLYDVISKWVTPRAQFSIDC
jgi:hypothetical protein